MSQASRLAVPPSAWISADEHHVRAERGELVGRAATDAAAGAGDHDVAAREEARAEHAAVAHGRILDQALA
jgi:hypothetical protein